MDNANLFGFGVRNYKSFDENGFCLDQINKINILIGKNNSGKSNILSAINLIANSIGRTQTKVPLTDSFAKSGKNVIIEVRLKKEDFYSEPICKIKGIAPYVSITWDATNGSRIKDQHSIDLKIIPWHLIEYWCHDKFKLNWRGQPSQEELSNSLFEEIKRVAVGSVSIFKNIVILPNFREIRMTELENEDSKNGTIVTINGSKIIKDLRVMQHPAAGREVEQGTFRLIERFVAELLESELSLEIQADADVILVNMHGKRLPLSSFGTGIHQLVILCSALAIHIQERVICIEEPEAHLHPTLQRKFLRFIADQTKNRYFITTHSNVFLDSNSEEVSVYHVSTDGTRTKVSRVDSTATSRQVIFDLGYKSSDLLHSNCVVWVEGPSDRVYLHKWLSLVAPELREGIHYSILFYGGSVRSHFTCIDDNCDGLIEVLKINKHVIWISDRDGKNAKAKVNVSKQRILDELGDERCWITSGREIENYLSVSTIKKYLHKKFDISAEVKTSSNARIDSIFGRYIPSDRKFKYSNSKPANARDIVEFILEQDLDVLDLRERITSIVALIKKWNHMK